MERQYFREFEFTEPVYEKGCGKEVVGVDRGVCVEQVCADEFLSPDERVVFENDPNVSCIEEVLPDFRRTLGMISQRIGYRFTMRKRELRLIDQEELKPNNPREVNRLVDRYGEYMREGGGGDCVLREDGSFLLRVGMVKEGLPKSVVLDVAAHEFGHSFGGFLESPVFEELKACGFASLFERAYIGSVDCTYEDKRIDLHPNRPHDVAIHRLGELLRKWIPEGAILSHLIGRRLGKFRPDDYLDHY